MKESQSKKGKKGAAKKSVVTQNLSLLKESLKSL